VRTADSRDMDEEHRPDWQMRPAVVYAVFFTGLGLSMARWWVGLAWYAIVVVLVGLARYAPRVLRMLLRL
jgi:hypothetical protein